MGRTRLTHTSNLPIGFVSFILILIFLNLEGAIMPEQKLPMKTKLRRLDLIGAAFLISALCCLLLALQWGGISLPWRSSRVIGLLTGSGLILVCFFLLQWKLGDDGTMPLHVLYQRSIAFGSAFELFVNMSNYTVNSFRGHLPYRDVAEDLFRWGTTSRFTFRPFKEYHLPQAVFDSSR